MTAATRRTCSRPRSNVATAAGGGSAAPLSGDRWELVVVGRPGTTAVEFAADGEQFTPIPTTDGVGRLVLDHRPDAGARIRVRRGAATSYAGPVDG